MAQGAQRRPRRRGQARCFRFGWYRPLGAALLAEPLLELLTQSLDVLAIALRIDKGIALRVATERGALLHQAEEAAVGGEEDVDRHRGEAAEGPAVVVD